jgi:hypothetical protein
MSVVPDSIEPKPQGDVTSPAEAPKPALAPPLAETTADNSPWVQASVYVVGAALVAAFLAWGIGEKTYTWFQPVMKGPVSQDFSVLNREKRIADQKNTAIVFGTFGALLGLVSGAAGGALRRSIPGGASAALAGLLLGGFGAALVSYEVTPIFARFYSDETASLLLSFLIRGGIWAVVGMTAGLALGCGWQGALGIPRALIGGLVGSVCGTIAFEMVNAVVFPGDRNDAVIPSSMPARLLAYLFVAISASWGAVFFGRSPSRPAGRTPAAHP